MHAHRKHGLTGLAAIYTTSTVLLSVFLRPVNAVCLHTRADCQAARVLLTRSNDPRT